MSDLANKHCVPCTGGLPPLTAAQITPLLAQLKGWQVADDHHLWKDYSFPDFRSALEFVNAIGAIAEQEFHHPDIHLAWGHVGVEIWTHKIDGLTESDFVLAARFDEALPSG